MNRPVEMTLNEVDSAWGSVVSTLYASRERAQENESDCTQIDVTLLTGFLGSGKTTILRRLLQNPEGLRIAAVVNDVGAVGVDAHLVNEVTSQQISLANGGACCALADDLFDQLESLASTGAYDAVVIEASGVADPVAIAQVIHNAKHCRLDGIVAVADLTCIDRQLSNQQIAPSVIRQLQAAHLVVMSKGDLSGNADRQRARDLVAGVAPGGQILEANHGEIDVRLIVGAALKGVSMVGVGGEGGLMVASVTVEPAGPWHPAELGKLLDSSTPRILRAKGWFEDPVGNLFHLQMVGRRWQIERWLGDAPKSVVLIGLSQDDVNATKDLLQRIRRS